MSLLALRSLALDPRTWAIVALALAALWYRGEAASESRRAAELEGAYLMLGERVREQNDAVESWKSTAETTRREALGALSAARLRSMQHEERAKSLRSAITSAAHADSGDLGCESALEGVSAVREVLPAAQQRGGAR